MKPGRGFTLMEVLIAGGLVALLGGIIMSFLVAALRQWSLTQSQGDGQMATLLAMHHIQHHLQHSDVLSVYINPNGTASGISFLSGVVPDKRQGAGYSLCQALNPNSNPDYTEDGQILWQQRCFYYLDDVNQVLHYVEQPFPASGFPGGNTNPTPYRQTAFAHVLGETDRIVTGSIFKLTFSASDPSPISPTIAALGGAGGMLAVPPTNPQMPVNNPVFVHLEGLTKGDLDASHAVKLDCAIVMDNRVPGGGVTLDANLTNVQRW